MMMNLKHIKKHQELARQADGKRLYLGFMTTIGI